MMKVKSKRVDSIVLILRSSYDRDIAIIQRYNPKTKKISDDAYFVSDASKDRLGRALTALDDKYRLVTSIEEFDHLEIEIKIEILYPYKPGREEE